MWLNEKEQLALRRVVEQGRIFRDRAIVVVLIQTGLRVGELCGLRWSDIQMSRRKGWLLVRRGKGQLQREIPLNAEARNAFREVGYGRFAGSDQAVFIGQRGPLSARGVQTMLAKYFRRAGLTSRSAHHLRHTFCKNLINKARCPRRCHEGQNAIRPNISGD